jgi:hypothetical protein
MKKRFWILVVSLITTFIISGCMPTYNVQRSVQPPTIKTLKVTPKSGVVHIPSWHFEGRPSAKEIYTDGNELYFVRYDRKSRKYYIYGLTKSFQKNSYSKKLLIAGLRHVDTQSYKNGYHAFVPDMDLYIRSYVKDTYHVGVVNIVDMYDTVIEYTDDYQNDPGFLKIQVKNRQKIRRQMLQKNIAAFVERYNLSGMIDIAKSEWKPKNNPQDIALNGKGLLKLYYKDRTYADDAEIDGYFENGHLVGSADVTVYGSYCTLKILVCVEGVKDNRKYSVNGSNLASVINRGFNEITDRIRELVNAREQAKHASSSYPSVSRCQRRFDSCIETCGYKNSKNIGLLHDSDEQECSFWCKQGKTSCQQGKESKSIVETCSAMCKGASTKSGVFPFESSDYDSCKSNCMVELN